jgi:hypothetical protein
MTSTVVTTNISSVRLRLRLCFTLPAKFGGGVVAVISVGDGDGMPVAIMRGREGTPAAKSVLRQIRSKDIFPREQPPFPGHS